MKVLFSDGGRTCDGRDCLKQAELHLNQWFIKYLLFIESLKTTDCSFNLQTEPLIYRLNL